MTTEIADLEREAARPDFWSDVAAAQNVQQRLGELRAQLEQWDGFNRELETLDRDREALTELERAGEAEVAGLAAEWEARLADLERRFRKAERATLLSGPYDRHDALLSIHAGAGGIDAQDWAEMLARMYVRFAERRAWKATKLDESRGEEQGIKNVTFQIDGRAAYGFLKGESGVHRLVRLSPFSANQLRHTSFALVEVLPVLTEREAAIAIKPEDLRIDLFRSSGAGGQNVNKRETAVRITHLPTGIVVASQEERQQSSNRERAMAILRAKLFQLMEQEHTKELANLKGKRLKIEWGHQIRSYVMQPYQLVKDLRTGIETPRVQDVLDGELDPFIEAELRHAPAAHYDVEKRTKRTNHD